MDFNALQGMDVMIPARFRHKITIQYFAENSPPQDSYGAPSGTWTTYATPWAEKVDKKGREFFAGGVIAEGTSIFRIWYDSGITTAMRVYYDSKYWDIKSISEIGFKDGQELICTVQS